MANRKVGTAPTEVLAQLPLACTDEQSAVEFFEGQRWGETPCCPKCGSVDVKQMRDRHSNRSARWLWRCADCRKLGESGQFSVRVGTIMEGSPIPLRHWAYAFYEACKSKKGVSAKEIQRQCHISFKSAL